MMRTICVCTTYYYYYLYIDNIQIYAIYTLLLTTRSKYILIVYASDDEHAIAKRQ